MKKIKKDKEFEERFDKRRKRARKKELLNVFLRLLLPSFLACILLYLSVYTMGLSLIFVYFVLPMFYTVEKRIRCLVSGIGNIKFSYGDGYRAFFQGNRGGIFGVIFSVIGSFVLGLFRYLLRYTAMVPLLEAFPASKVAYQAIQEAITKGDPQNLTRVVSQNLSGLCQPLSILAAIIFYLPIFYFFFSVDSSLSNHYLACVVLPDIDSNISAGQAKNLSRGSFGSFTAGFRTKKYFSKNWPFFVLYTILYGLTTFGISNIQTGISNLVPLIRMAPPLIGFFLYCFLNVFILINAYSVIEESQDLVLNSLPPTRKVSIYQTYCNPDYIHGEESARRGCFIPADQGNGASSSYYSPFNNNNPFGQNPFASPRDNQNQDPPESEEKKLEENRNPQDEEPTGGVFDFTKDKKDDQ